ncbi:hypothetical protein JCM12296A_29770 [Desulfosarcina cetonica]
MPGISTTHLSQGTSLFGKIICFLFLLLLTQTDLYAGEWFVRPAGGAYGREDGTSYKNAWNGLAGIIWGTKGVHPGDTLWICGLHLHAIRDRYSFGNRALKLGSGTSENERIVLRGDYPNDAGIIWGAGRIEYAQWTDEGNGVWSIPLIAAIWAGDWIFQDIGQNGANSHVVLDKADSLSACRLQSGSHFSPSYKKGSKLYVHPTDERSPKRRISINWWGYRLEFNRQAYLTFKNISFLNPGRVSLDARLHHIRWHGCKLIYGMHALIGLHGEHSAIEVIGCELAWAGNGIYTIQQNWQAGKTEINKTVRDYRFAGNHIHHIGVRPVNWNGDAHAIGIQGGSGGIIEDNLIENCGTGPGLYAFTHQECKNTVVRRNVVKNLHRLGGATGYGVFTMCNQDSLSDKTGNIFYQNVVVNAHVGYRFQFEDKQRVFHNMAINCNIGFESTRGYKGNGANVELKNNIFYNSKECHVKWTGAAEQFTIDFDHNIYYPDEHDKFWLILKRDVKGCSIVIENRKSNFKEWQRHRVKGCRFDPNSLSRDPQLLYLNTFRIDTSNLVLSDRSPVIDAGIPVGINEDFYGHKIIGIPDIGPFEFQKIDTNK